MNLQSVITTSLAFLIISASGLAAAGPEKKDKSDKDVLRGPRVVTTSPNQPSNSRDAMNDKRDNSDKMSTDDAQASRPIVFREYLGALRQLQGTGDTQTLSLTEDQKEQVRKIAQDHRQAMTAFQEANRDRIREMRESMRPDSPNQQKETQRQRPTIESQDQSNQRDKKQGDKQANKQENNQGNKQGRQQSEQQRQRGAQMREKLRNFIDNAPANKEALTKLKAIISADQLAALDAHIHKARAQRGANNQRPDQTQPRRARPGAAERQDESKTETNRPRAPRRQIDRDQTENSGNKGSQRGKRSKNASPEQEKPTKEDD